MSEFKKSPKLANCCLEEQMVLSDPQTALLFQIREELREMNYNLRKLNKPPEPEKESPKLEKKKK